MKLLDQAGTDQLAKDYNKLQHNLHELKKGSPPKQKTKSILRNSAATGDKDFSLDSNNNFEKENNFEADQNNQEEDGNQEPAQRWGSASKDSYRTRRMKKQARDILGKTVDIGKYSNIKVLKPSAPLSKPLLPNGKNKATRLPKDDKREQAGPDSFRSASNQSRLTNFAIVSIEINNEVLEFETTDEGQIQLSQIQNYIPHAVGLYYIQHDDATTKKRVLPITTDGNFIKPPRGSAGWSTSPSYLPILPQFVKVPMTPKSEIRKAEENRHPENFVPDQTATELNSEILSGSYDEEANRLEFQQAVMAFRNAGKAETETEEQHEAASASLPTRPKSATESVGTSTTPDVEIQFNNTSKLTADDRKELEMLRKEFKNGAMEIDFEQRLDDEKAAEKAAAGKQLLPPFNSREISAVSETNYEHNKKLKEIELERAEIREMFVKFDENDDEILEAQFSYNEACSSGSSSRTVTPRETAEVTSELINRAPEPTLIKTNILPLSEISKLQLDYDILDLQEKYKNEHLQNKRPRTGQGHRPSSSASNSALSASRPMTPSASGYWSNLDVTLIERNLDTTPNWETDAAMASSTLAIKNINKTWANPFNQSTSTNKIDNLEKIPENQTNLEKLFDRKLSNEIMSDPEAAKVLSRAFSFSFDSDVSRYSSRPVTAASTVIDEKEMQEIENAFHLDDEEY